METFKHDALHTCSIQILQDDKILFFSNSFSFLYLLCFVLNISDVAPKKSMKAIEICKISYLIIQSESYHI